MPKAKATNRASLRRSGRIARQTGCRRGRSAGIVVPAEAPTSSARAVGQKRRHQSATATTSGVIMESFHQVMTQILCCPICLTVFSDPKSLSCAHTFCLACLEQLHEAQSQPKTMSCPVCRKQTLVPSGGVTKLNTNIHLESLREAVKVSKCMNCAPSEESPAAVYCRDCSALMCMPCENIHSKWKFFSKHTVLVVDDFEQEDIPLKGRHLCEKHQIEVDYFCPVCRMYICFKCVIYHAHEGQQNIPAIEHEEGLKTNIEELHSAKEKRKEVLLSNIESTDKQQVILKEVAGKVKADVDKIYNSHVRRLEAHKTTVMVRVSNLFEELERDLLNVTERNRHALRDMETVDQFVRKAMEAPLERHALSAHETLREILGNIIQRDVPDDTTLKNIMHRASGIKFFEVGVRNEPSFGKLRDWRYKWVLKARTKLAARDVMSCMAARADGTMAIGYRDGGIDLFIRDGTRLLTELGHVMVRGMDFLSDGRCVVRDKDNDVSVYTQTFELDRGRDAFIDTEKIENVQSEGVSIDGDDRVYICNREFREIDVHILKHGNRDHSTIDCGVHKPNQIVAQKSHSAVIVTSSNSVLLLEKETSEEKKHVTRENACPFPTDCQDGSIVIAWVVSDNLLTVARYTSELEYMYTFLEEFPFKEPKNPKRYYVREFCTGELAFCTTDRLYIFGEKYSV